MAKKVFVVCDTLIMGGAETFTMRMARYYKERGHQVTLVALRGDQVNYELVRENAGADIPLLSFRPPAALNWVIYKIDGLLARLNIYSGLRIALTTLKFKKIIARGAADVVHTNMITSLD